MPSSTPPIAAHILLVLITAVPTLMRSCFATRCTPLRLLVVTSKRCRRGAIVAMSAPADYNQRWEAHWSDGDGLKPGQRFDASGPSPALLHLLSSGELQVAGKRAFVPGCGRGYDLAALVRAGAAQAVGLELAPTAAVAAREYLSQQAGLAAEAVPVVEGDFFKYASPEGAFDCGFDYTFCCALHPGMRRDWAAAWARVLRPGGQLVTLIFPVDPAAPEQGPPWPVTPELYKDLLLPAGFTLQSLERVPDERSHPGRGGKEYLGVWVRA